MVTFSNPTVFIVMNKEHLKNIVSESFNYTQVCEKIYKNRYRGNRETIIKYIKEYNIDISHFTYRGNKKGFSIKRPLNTILIENSTYTSTTNLKERLYKEGLKKRKCELCDQGEEWRGKKMSLILDHINGINNDNRIENLRIVCPNCNATLDTHGGKNVELRKKKRKKTESEKKKNRIETSINQRKVIRPPYDELLNEIKLYGYVGTGKRHGVSDNAIRKWIKFYEKFK